MKEDEPLISIIIPMYNSEKYLEETLESVLLQSYFCWEAILVDDGSVDSTSIIAKKFCYRDKRFRYYHQDNQGQALARNTGLANASGDIVAFLDHDDLWLPNKLSDSFREFQREEQDVLFTSAYFFTRKEDLNELTRLERMEVVDRIYEGNDGLSLFLYSNKIPMLTVLAKKRVLLEVGSFRKLRITDDYCMWLTLLFNGYRLRGINKPLSCHRIHNDSLSSRDRLGSRDVLFLLQMMKEDFPYIMRFHDQIKTWIRKFIKKGLLPEEDLQFLIDTLKYWGCYSKLIQLIILLKPLFPFRWFQSWLCKAL